MAWFESRSSRQRKSAVMNAICVMMADGKVEEAEKVALAAVCARAGITEAELEELLDHPDRVKFVAPDSVEERFYQVADAVFMMMVDGEVDAREFVYCSAFAERLGFDADIVPGMVKDLIEAIQRDVDPVTLQSQYVSP